MVRPLSPETLVYGLAAAGDPQISPDGTRILYSLAKVDRESKKPGSQLWVCDLDGANLRRLSWSGDNNGGGRWSPNGTQIAFVSDRVKKSGIFVLPADGVGEARELTKHGQGIGDLAWSPDGKTIAYTTTFDPENPNEEEPAEGAPPKVKVTRRIDYKWDGRGYLNDLRRQVFVVDVAGGERRKVTREPVDYAFPHWSPDGRTLSAQVSAGGGLTVRLALIDVATGAEKRVGSESGMVGTWSWSPGGDRIVIAGDDAFTFQLDFLVYDIASGNLRRITDDLQCLPQVGFPGFGSQATPRWLDGQRVLFHAYRAAASGFYVLDVESGKVEQVADSQARNNGFSVDRANRYVVQGHGSFEALGEISVFDVAAGTARVISRTNADALAESSPASWERFEIERGGFTTEAWLLKPPGFDPTKRYPLILDVHGGPNGFYGYGFDSVQQCLATNGFLVAIANPRGSTSYGRHFTQQVFGDWGGEDFQDLMAVVDRVLERPYADRERTGIYGYSYGGYMTAWTISQTTRFQAAVCGAPCFDLESMYGTSDISYHLGALQWTGVPHDARAWYESHSPSTFAHQTRTPTLIVHGEADERCPIGQGEQMFVTLHQAGCEVEFARYPGGSHIFPWNGPSEHREDFLTRVLGWFKSHLGEPT